MNQTLRAATIFVVWLWHLLLLPGEMNAQQNVATTIFPLMQENISLDGTAEYAITNGNVSDLSAVRFNPFTILRRKNGNDSWKLSDAPGSTWIQFKIQNKCLRDTAVVLNVLKYNEEMILYEQANAGFKEVGRSGQRVPVSRLSMKDDSHRIKIPLKGGQIQAFLLQEQYAIDSWVSIPVLQSLGQAALEQQRYENKTGAYRKYVLILLSGFHLAIFFLSLIKFFTQKRDKAYLLYSLFNGSLLLLYLVDNNILVIESRYWDNLKNDTDGSFFFNSAASLLYVAFQVELLQLRTTKPKVVAWINLYVFIVIVGVLLTIIFNQLQLYPSIWNYSILALQAGNVLGALMLTYLTHGKKGYLRYIFYGAVSLLAGCAAFVAVHWSGAYKYMGHWFTSDYLLIVPVAIEVVFFLMALVYRDKLTEIEKVQAQQQLVQELKKNRIIQENFTRSLENQVKQKTEQLIEQRSVLEKEREAKIYAEFEQKLSESELKALRSQINPHFIFNVLNTIESYALQNRPQVVSQMIQKFSRLTRLILENSLHPVVPLRSDLEGLKLYIELEQMRYNEKFEVRYDINEEVLDHNCSIPSMIVQPYVENAIIHGLRNLPGGDGLLTISARFQDEYIIIIVEDNGVGRISTTGHKGGTTITRSSVGMRLTQNRIMVFNKLIREKQARVVVQDLVRGTRVMLWFPVGVSLSS